MSEPEFRVILQEGYDEIFGEIVRMAAAFKKSQNQKGTAMTTEDLMALVRKAQERFDALSDEQKREHRSTQRRSWVIGELMLQNPSMTKEEAAECYDKGRGSQ